ncbi:MAG TPA: DUF1579 family protein [Terriglobales bacterium]|jgi:hypothetical protein|nr:DUF1579 family protein [Terriglobales bacterium]
MKRIAMVMSLVLLAAVVILAQQKKSEDKAAAKAPAKSSEGKKEAAPALPKPSPEMEKLSKVMVGDWVTEEKFEANDFLPAGTGKGSESTRLGPGGLSLVSDYHSKNVMGEVHGHGMIWWDPKEQVFRNLWCDNVAPSGCELSGPGKWEGDSLVFHDETEMLGRKIVMKVTLTDLKPDSHTFTVDIAGDNGEMQRGMSFHYVRKPAAAAKPAPKP